jgi:ankyrin repeat protein
VIARLSLAVVSLAVALASFDAAPLALAAGQPAAQAGQPQPPRPQPPPAQHPVRAALEAAVRANDPSRVAQLAPGCKALPADACSLDALLIYSIRGARPWAAIALLQQGASAEARDATGETALALTAERGNAAVARALLQAGADPAARLPSGETAMHRAAAYGRGNIIDVLAGAGADVDVRIRSSERRDGWTPLMVATVESQLVAVQVLLERSAEVDARNTRGRTALLLAAWYGAEDIVERLLRAGADPTIVDASGITPERAATLTGDAVVMRYFKAHQTKGK